MTSIKGISTVFHKQYILFVMYQIKVVFRTKRTWGYSSYGVESITWVFINLYTNVLVRFIMSCFGYLLRQSGGRQSAVSHTSGKN